MTRSIAATAWVVASMLQPSALHAAEPLLGERPAEMSATLNYAIEDEAAASAFFRDLGDNAGKVILLDLTIVPRQDEANPGYSLVGAFEGKTDTEVLCGRDRIGVLDNYRDDWSLSPAYVNGVHATLSLNVGDRRTFPSQELACGLEGYTQHPLTNLHLKGYFAVQSADIPTAVEYVLTPYAFLGSSR